MALRLIINADDFGLTPGVNRAIAELHQANVLTSATLMATGAAFDDAVAIAHANPTLGVGCHIVLVDGIPVLPSDHIPTLVSGDGKTFRPSLSDFVKALYSGSIREEEIEREAIAQIENLQRAGIRITHLDTHKHTHLFPAVTRPLLRAAERCSIRALRNPFEPKWNLALGHGSTLRRLQVKILSRLKPHFEQQPAIRARKVLTTEGTLGITSTGQLDASALRDILHALPAHGTFELCCHPGYNDSALAQVTTRLRRERDIERNALLAEVPATALHPNAPQLIHYGNLALGSIDEESVPSNAALRDVAHSPQRVF
ncbi:MAG: ChbG/HpnK family deacetylase [Acidobacteriota bacterium]|nr:ChbG/HpnK family deacetylase [Acidobacteriota bacterium]